jgi:hypothetical protein
LSPQLQVQGGVKAVYQETLALLLPFSHLAEWVTPLPTVKLFYLTHPGLLLQFFHLEHKDQGLLRTTIAENMCGDASQEQPRGAIPVCYFCSSFLFPAIFLCLWSHASPPDVFEPNTTHSLGGTLVHLMLWSPSADRLQAP